MAPHRIDGGGHRWWESESAGEAGSRRLRCSLLSRGFDRRNPAARGPARLPRPGAVFFVEGTYSLQRAFGERTTSMRSAIVDLDSAAEL